MYRKYQLKFLGSFAFLFVFIYISIAFSAQHNNISIQYINSPANTIPENSSLGTPLAYIYSTNSTPYEITDSHFYIDTYYIENNLQYRLNASSTYNIDYESSQPGFSYTLTVYDSKGYSKIPLTIGDVNESPLIQPQSFYLTENTTKGTIVYQVIASDPDLNTDYNTLTYGFESTNGSNALTINEQTGEIRVNDSTDLDYETNRNLYLTVVVSDGKYKDVATITVHLININDNAPQVSDQTFSVGKDVPIGTLVSTVFAQDPDGDNLTYQLGSGNTNNAFTINSSTGKITVNNPSQILNNSEASYFVTVYVSDSGYTQTAQVRVDVNTSNYPPVINTISDYYGTVDTARHIVFNVQDSNGETLNLTVKSEDVHIISNTNTRLKIENTGRTYSLVVYEGSKDLTLTILPGNVTGTALITITATDESTGNLLTTKQFNFNVLSNSAPKITPIGTQPFDIDAISFHRGFTVSDSIGENVVVEVGSDSHDVVPQTDDHISIDSSGRSKSFQATENPLLFNLQITPVIMGTASIHITATDAGGLQTVETFLLRVSSSPEISAIESQETNEDNISSAIPFTIRTHEPGSLTLSIQSQNNDLIPTDNHITLCFNSICEEGASRTINAAGGIQENLIMYILPDNNKFGSTNITVFAKDFTGLTQTTDFTLTVFPINDAPVITSIGDPLQYTEGDSPLQLLSSPIFEDIDDTLFENAKIVISQNYQSGADTLSFKATEHISGLFFQNTGVLQLTGVDSLTAYQTAFQSIMYSNTSENPSPLARTFSITVNDGDVDSAVVTQTLTLTAINDPPVITATTRIITCDENVPTAIAPDIKVTDLDNANLPNAEIKFVDGYLSTEDMLVFSDMGSITGSWQTSSGILYLAGAASPAQYQAALQSIKYNNTSDTPNTYTRLVRMEISDGLSQSESITQTIFVNPINDKPIVAGAGSSVKYTENAAPLVIAGDITIENDIDSENMVASATIYVSEGFQKGSDVLSLGISGNTKWFADSGVLGIYGSNPRVWYQAALSTVLFNNTSDDPTSDNRVIAFIINDGQSSSEPIYQTVNVIPVNDPPSLIADTLVIDYTENTSLSMAEKLTISDLDNDQFTGALIRITTGYKSFEDQLSFTQIGNIASTWDSQSGSLTLTGSDKILTYRQALNQVFYENLSENPTLDSRSVVYKVYDGQAWSESITRTVQIIPINDAPIITIDESYTYTENSGAMPIAQSFSMIDYDNLDISQIAVQITENYDQTQDQLNINASPEIQSTWNAETGTLTLTGKRPISDYLNLVNTLTYENVSDNPLPLERKLSYQAWDDTDASDPIFQDIILIPINDAPVLTGGGTIFSITENHMGPIFNTIEATDIDNTLLASATITLTSGYQSAEDILVFDNTNLISSSWDSETGQLQLSGPASPSLYQKALNAVQYTNTSDNPKTNLRTVTVTINDGSLESNTITGTVQIIPVNDIPVISGGENYTYVENTKITLDSIFEIEDPDSTTMDLAIVSIAKNFQANEDVLSLTPVGNITGTFNAEAGKLTLTGPDDTESFITALSRIVYENTSDNPSDSLRTLSISINDGVDESLAITETITVVPVNDPPVVSLSKTFISYTENAGNQILDSLIQTNDLDNTTLSSAIVKFIHNTYTAGEDSFGYTLTGNIQADWNIETGTLTFSGIETLENYQTVLSDVSYKNSSENPATHDRVVQWTVSDGSAESLSVTHAIHVFPVNDPPVLTGGGGALDYQENSHLTVANNIHISDVDNITIKSATIMIADGYIQGEDFLEYPENSSIGNIISAEMTPDTSVMILSGVDTLLNYQAALRLIQYYNSSDNPQISERRIIFSVYDGGGTMSSQEVERIIRIIPVNDAPHLPVNTGIIINEGESISLSTTNLSATDPDDPDAGLFYTIDVLPENGTLFLNSNPLIAGLTLIQGDIDEGRVSYTHDGGETISDQFTFHITDTNGIATEPKFFTITIIPVNDSPIITSTPIETAIEDVLYTYTVTVSDPDDIVNGSDIIFELQNEPLGMTISNMGLIQWTPKEAVLTSGIFTIVAKDGGENDSVASTQSFAIAVTPVEDPPELSSIDDLLTYGNTQAGPINFQLFDAEGGPLTLNVFSTDESVIPVQSILFQDQTPVQMNVDIAGETNMDYFLTIMPSFNQYGSVTITVLATDSTNLTTTSTFVLLVDKVTINVEHGRHGQIIPGHPAKVKKGQFIHFRINPDTGYRIDNVWVDNQLMGSIPSYTFWSVTEPHTISASFAESFVCTITTLSSNGGDIDPYGAIPYSADEKPVFHIIPEDSYIIEDVKVDGISVGPVEWYTFSPLDSVHTIRPYFTYVPKPAPLFSYDKDTGNIPLTIKFQDKSKGQITDWLWDFGDGFQSTDQHPEHTYVNAGEYNISLMVSGKGGQSQTVKSKAIKVLSKDVDFTSQVRTGIAPLSVSFINTTVLNEVSSWEWNFGDNNNSSEENPNHIYTQPGIYNVSLTAILDEENQVIEKTQYIHVKGRTIKGTVKDDSTGLGLSNILVELWQNDHLFMETRTTESGEYSLTSLPVSDGWIVSIWPDDLNQYLPNIYNGQINMKLATKLSTRESDLDEIDFLVVEAPSNGIKGQVHDGTFNSVGASVLVSVFSEKLNLARSQMTDENGYYTILGLLPSDDYKVSAWSANCGCEFFYYMENDQTVGVDLPIRSARTYRKSTPVNVADSLTQRINIIIESGGTISGNVKNDSGQPLTNVWVNAWSDIYEIGNGAFTDETGNYQIKCLRAESLSGNITYLVEVNPSDYPALIYNQVKQTEEATTVVIDSENIDFEFYKGLSIKGIVYDENGKGLQNIPVRVWSDSLAYTVYSQTLTNMEGEYTLSNLPTLSDYIISVYPTYYPMQYYPAALSIEMAQTVDLSLNAANGIDFQLNPGEVIKGIVYQSDGTTPGPMGLLVNIWSESTQTGGNVPLDANGRYEITGLLPKICDYIISIHQPPYVPAYYGESSGHEWTLSWETAKPVCSSSSIDRNIILQNGYSFSGNISYNGEAVSNALIQLWSPGSGIFMETYSSISDDTTNFSLLGLSDGTYEISVFADGFADIIIENIGIHSDVTDFNIELKRPENVISGTVYGLETGKKVQINAWAQSINDGHMIRLTGNGNPQTYSITNLGSAKDYRIELWSMDYPYQVYPGGHQFNDAENIQLNGIVRNIDFHLATIKSNNLSGTITPWPGAKSGDVIFIDAVSQTIGAAKNSRIIFESNNPVTYEIKGLPLSNDYIVSVWSNVSPMMYYQQTFNIDEAKTVEISETAATGVDFELTDGMTISGTLYKSDGQPLAGSLLTAGSQSFNIFQSALSNLDGQFEIKGLTPATDYKVSAIIKDTPTIYYQTSEKSVFNSTFASLINLSKENASNVDIHIPAGQSICGTVKDFEGHAIKFAWLSAQSEITGAKNDTFTDIHGNFCITGLPDSVDYQLTIIPPKPYIETIRSMIPTNTNELRCNVEKGYELSGTVKTQSNIALSKVEISVWSSDKNFHSRTTTNSSGKFLLQGIPQAFDLFLTVEPSPQQNVARFIDGPFAVTDNLEKNITLGQAIEIKGHVQIKYSEKGLKDALITAYASSVQADAQIKSDVDGAFSFTNLPEADDYKLTITHPDYATKIIPFLNAQDDLIIMLDPGGSITGHVQDEKGNSITNIRIDIQSDDQSYMSSSRTDNNGNFVFTGLPLMGQTFSISGYGQDKGFAQVTRAGQSPGSHVLLLMIKDTTNRISGNIKDSSSNVPLSHTTITLRLFDTEGVFIQKEKADINGNYEFTGLNFGKSYIIKCSVGEDQILDRFQWIGPNGLGTLDYAEAYEYEAGSLVDIILLGNWQ